MLHHNEFSLVASSFEQSVKYLQMHRPKISYLSFITTFAAKGNTLRY